MNNPFLSDRNPFSKVSNPLASKQKKILNNDEKQDYNYKGCQGKNNIQMQGNNYQKSNAMNTINIKNTINTYPYARLSENQQPKQMSKQSLNNKYEKYQSEYQTKNEKSKFLNNKQSDYKYNPLQSQQGYKQQNNRINSEKITFGDPASSYDSYKTSDKKMSQGGEIDKNLFRKTNNARTNEIYRKKQFMESGGQNEQYLSKKPFQFQSPPKEVYQTRNTNHRQLQNDYHGKDYKNNYKYECGYEYGAENNLPFGERDLSLLQPKFRNNGNELSPIGQVSRHKINDSFQNLDAIINDTDLSKLLADSRNQSDLLKILGMANIDIGRTKDIEPQSTAYKNIDYDYDYGKNKTNYSQGNFKSYGNKITTNDHKNNQRQNQKQKQYNFQSRLREPEIQVYKYSQYQQTDRVPAFKSIQHKHSKSPYSNIMLSEYPQNKYHNNNIQSQPQTQTISQIKKLYHDHDQDPPKVKNYQTSNENKNSLNLKINAEQSLESIMARQMKKMCMVGNGKNRIFLTSNEKFNTIRYNLKGL